MVTTAPRRRRHRSHRHRHRIRHHQSRRHGRSRHRRNHRHPCRPTLPRVRQGRHAGRPHLGSDAHEQAEQQRHDRRPRWRSGMMCDSSQTNRPVRPPVATAPNVRPKMRRRIEPPIRTAKNSIGNRPSRLSPGRCHLRSGGGSSSPSATLHDLLQSGADAAVDIALPEQRRDGVADDAPGGDIGQRAFQPVAHFNAHGAVLQCHQQQHAIIGFLAAQLPGLGHAQRILLDGLGRRWSAPSATPPASPCAARRPRASAPGPPAARP